MMNPIDDALKYANADAIENVIVVAIREAIVESIEDT